MNVTRTISIALLATAAAWGQSTATKPVTKPAATAAKSAATKATATKPASQMAPAAAKTAPARSAAAATKPMAKATAKTTSAASSMAPAKNAKASKSTTAAATTKKPAAKTAKAVSAKTAPVKAAAKSIAPEKPLGKRDPFVSVIVARADSTAACSGGKRCLVVDQLALRGIVRTPTKWIALVENPARKTYYLYENDPIFNAVVVRITGDSVIFRESIMDALGHSTEREVVKRVNAPAI